MRRLLRIAMEWAGCILAGVMAGFVAGAFIGAATVGALAVVEWATELPDDASACTAERDQLRALSLEAATALERCGEMLDEVTDAVDAAQRQACQVPAGWEVTR